MAGGQDPALFWHLTLREIDIVMSGVVARLERERQLGESLIWTGAQLNAFAFHKPADIPDLEKMRAGRRAANSPVTPSVRQDWRTMHAKIIAFNAALGGEYRT